MMSPSINTHRTFRARAAVIALAATSSLAMAQNQPSELRVVGQEVLTTSVQIGAHGRSTTQVISQNIVRGTSGGHVDRGCPAVTDSVAANFNSIDVGGEITLQLGTRQNEGFGAVYNVPATNWPLEVNLVEQFFGTIASGAGNITAGYTVEIYDGDPSQAGAILKYSVISDPDPSSTGLPGDIVLQRVTTCNTNNGANASVGKLQVSVDQTADPTDRWILSNESGQNRFAVIIRLTRMNSPNANPCAIIGGEDPPCSNIFPATEANNSGALNFPTRDLLVAISCPNNPFAAPGGTYRFSQLAGVSPTRDVLQQVTYTSQICTPPATGACCNAATGACSLVTQAQCTSGYQGDNTTCTPTNPCPQPTGACCLPTGACEIRASNNCTGTGFIFRGANTTCATANCPQPTGACCNGTACAAGVTASTCATLGGQFIGANSVCGPSSTCPLGACCLNTGACAANISQPACTSQNGTFQGVGSVCASVNCPQPSGACCTSSGGCADVTQATCALFAGTWQGALTTCASTNCQPSTGLCCRGATCAASVQASSCTGANTLFTAGSTATCPGSNTSPCCKADFNKVGGITVQDIFDFIAAWFSGSSSANITSNGAGAPTVQSIFDFLAAWFAGGC